MLDLMRVFLVALEEGSFNRAATRLRMSQSALSRQMQALEAEIGGALFERTTSGVRPTETGYLLARSMPPILASYEAAVAEARRQARGQNDLLRIGYLGSAAQIFLNPALAKLRKECAQVKVKLQDLSPGEQIAALRKGEIDLGVIGQEGGMVSREFYTRKLETLPVLAIVPAEHPLAGKKNVSLSELRGERFVASPEEDLPGRDRWIVQLCRKAGFRPHFGTEAETISHLFTLVSGEGLVALVPGYLTKYPAGGVAMIEIADEWARWDFLIVWQRGKASRALTIFLAALADTVKESCEGQRKISSAPPPPKRRSQTKRP